MTALISTEELAEKIASPQIRILDASWYMPAENRDAYAEYLTEHIPHAIFFDIDAICDHTSPYPHMLPSARKFAQSVSDLGVSNDDEIVVYDSSGLFSAARVWWMFRVFGHEKVRVLSGGLPKWKAEQRPLEADKQRSEMGSFRSNFQPGLLRRFEQMQDNITNKEELVIDARSPGRFSGAEPEPRPGLRSGHIEGSTNIFFKECLMSPYNELKPHQDLVQLLGNTATHKITVTCGSGVTACILALALYELGNKDVAVYDGAWAEWGSRTS